MRGGHARRGECPVGSITVTEWMYVPGVTGSAAALAPAPANPPAAAAAVIANVLVSRTVGLAVVAPLLPPAFVDIATGHDSLYLWCIPLSCFSCVYHLLLAIITSASQPSTSESRSSGSSGSSGSSSSSSITSKQGSSCDPSG